MTRIINFTILVAAIVLCGGAAHAQKAGKKSIVIKGSDTMVQLSAHWAEVFMDKNPDYNVAVTGGGSGVGIAALINGTTDICNASRDMKPEEKKQKGIDNGVAANEINVALDGVAVVVNKSNPLTEISKEQLKRIYTGKTADWDAFGAPKGKIIVLSRESSSGTYVFFQESVLDKEDYSPNVRMMPATSAILESVASDKGAIGYVGLGYATAAKDRVKVLPVKVGESAPAVMPSEETVHSKEYPLARPLHVYTNGRPKGLVKVFIDFCLSPDGQEIVREDGFVPLQ